MSESWIILVLVLRLVSILVPISIGIYLLFLLIKALRLYIRSQEGKKEYTESRKTLGQNIKEHRERCKMTQEFVAQSLGVSRQAVSKWENGVSDPSTSNLLALSKCFQIPIEELLQNL